MTIYRHIGNDRSWCNHALNASHWTETAYIDVCLSNADGFVEAAQLIRSLENDGWKYLWINGDLDSLRFTRDVPVTDEEREQAREWLEKYSG